MPEILILEEVIERNLIDARWFVPFLIYRLQSAAINRIVTLEVVLENVFPEPYVKRELRLTWRTESVRLASSPVQEHIITEWASCGIACIVVPLYIGLQIVQVAQAGDRFDYWVGNEVYELGLEVSGTLLGDLERRHRSKISQLRANPYQLDGFVSVTDFRDMRTRLSFHQFK